MGVRVSPRYELILSLAVVLSSALGSGIDFSCATWVFLASSRLSGGIPHCWSVVKSGVTVIAWIDGYSLTYTSCSGIYCVINAFSSGSYEKRTTFYDPGLFKTD